MTTPNDLPSVGTPLPAPFGFLCEWATHGGFPATQTVYYGGPGNGIDDDWNCHPEVHENLPIYTVEQMQAYARAALAAQPGSVGEPVAWQFRWTNPGDNINAHPDELAWKALEPRGSETMAERMAEIAHYTYDGKPCYEVRALGVLAAAPTEAKPAQDAVDAKRYRHMRDTAIFADRNGPGLYWYLPREHRGLTAGERLDKAIDAAISAKKVGA